MLNSTASPAQSGTTPASRSIPADLISNLTAGTLAALVTLSYSISYGVLIYSGADLERHHNEGLHCALMTAWIAALLVALGSSFHFSIAGPDSNATAILAIMSSSVASSLAASGAYPDEIAATVLVMLAGSAIVVGLFVFNVGALKRGRLVRFLPYPVIGGFLAGTGFLLVGGAFKVLTGKPLNWETVGGLFTAAGHARASAPALAWIVAGGLAIGLLIVPRFWRHFLAMPVLIAGAGLLFYAGLKFSGMSLDDARQADLLFRPFEPFQGREETRGFFTLVRWDALFAQWQNLLGMTIVVIVTILLNATGLDLATQSDVDFDRELRINGIANIVSGLFGGMIGYLSISRSMLNFKAGAVSRFAGLWTALVCLGATYAFTPALAFFPRPVLAGLLLFLGLSMLREWLWEAFFKLPLIEYELLATILMLILVLGLLPGVAFGMLVASVSFVYTYSRASCIKHSFASNTHFSNKERSLEQIAELRKRGNMGRALVLQGYIFFGTSSTIVDECRELIEKKEAKHLLLDFRTVQGIDASAVLSFTKLEQICQRNGTKLLFSGLRPEVEDVLKQTRFLPSKSIKVYSDLDRGLEWIEDTILGVVAGAVFTTPTGDTQVMMTAAVAEMDLRRILSAHFKREALDVLISYCETLKLKEGTVLFHQGDAADSLYFVERGELSVLLRIGAAQPKRLRTFGPGTVVGEMGLYGKQPRSADVVTDMNCRVRRFSAENIARMESEHPDVAIQFHSFVIKLLSARLIAANEEIRALL